MPGDVFTSIFIPDELVAATGGDAWVRALIRAEVALAAAEADCRVIPPEAADAIAAAARTFHAEPDDLARRGKGVGNPAAGVVPMFTAHVAQTSPEAAKYVHLGATSQDIVDTAAMLVASGALAVVEERMHALAAVLAALVRTRRAEPMVGRTLLQQALPLTLGVTAAGWLSGVLDAIDDVAAVRATQLAAQLGGAVGTLASLGEEGPAVAAAFAHHLGLVDPGVPWHTNRTRIARIGAALALTAGVAGKIGLDLVLLAQTEVGEFVEADLGGSGGSSTMPHKRNPIAAVAARGAALQVPGLVATLHLAMAHEHERAAGAWHAEWHPLMEALRLAGGAVDGLVQSLDGAEFPAAAAAENLGRTHGLLMAERVTTRLAAVLGRLEAHHLMQRVSLGAVESGTPLHAALLAEPEVTARLTAAEIDELFDAGSYLGSAETVVERVLERWTAQEEGAHD